MAWRYVETSSLQPDGFNSKDPDNLTQYQKDNIQEIVTKYTGLGYTLNAIAGIICNMLEESYINPAQYQTTYNPSTDLGGFGLVQWSNNPDGTRNFSILREWMTARGYDKNDGDKQLDFLNGMNNYIPGTWFNRGGKSQWYLPWEQYKTSTREPDYLARVFFESFERGTWNNRERTAIALFNYISSLSPVPPQPPDPPTPPIPAPPSPEIYARKKFPIYLYLRRQ